MALVTRTGNKRDGSTTVLGLLDHHADSCLHGILEGITIMDKDTDITIPAHIFAQYVLAWARTIFPWPDLQARCIMVACSWACLGQPGHGKLMRAIDYVTEHGEEQ